MRNGRDLREIRSGVFYEVLRFAGSLPLVMLRKAGPTGPDAEQKKGKTP
jgi:hypothetical protein